VAGTLALVADQYLHPRIFATAFALFALAALLGRSVWAIAWVALAALVHPQVTVFALLHLAFQAWPAGPLRITRTPQHALLAWLPLPAADEAWREVMLTRRHHFPLRWHWYEWLGAIAPVALLAWFAQIGARTGNTTLQRVSWRLTLSCIAGTLGALAINVIPPLVRFMPTQPMRHLHLVYVLIFVLGGGLLDQYVLKSSVLRWGLALGLACAPMIAAQLYIFPASSHIEWPGAHSRNDWLAAFAWIRENTPTNAYFALDPHHMELDDEDNHGFRALAERSMMADYTKDRGVAAIFPSIAVDWKRQVDARARWHQFRYDDFARLKRDFGVNWVVVDLPQDVSGAGGHALDCPYRNATLKVCRIE
jgi:hypothetical protein